MIIYFLNWVPTPYIKTNFSILVLSTFLISGEWLQFLGSDYSIFSSLLNGGERRGVKVNSHNLQKNRIVPQKHILFLQVIPHFGLANLSHEAQKSPKLSPFVNMAEYPHPLRICCDEEHITRGSIYIQCYASSGERLHPLTP